MLLKVASSAGFCFGVRNAVNKAMSLIGNNVYTLGELIHNEYVIDKLKARGIICAGSIDEIPDGATVIIRSHGEGASAYNKLTEKGCVIEDATCPFVEKIHSIVKDYYENNYQIVIIGDREHPEVKGINGWCGNEAIIVGNIEEAEALNGDKYCVVVQTTFDYANYIQISQIIKNRVKIVALNETICYTTKVRQEEALRLAGECSVMLIIGSATSANTRKLFDISKSLCPRTYLISEKTELSSIKFNNNDIVGITAGASTPKELMTEVINIMEELKNMAGVQDPQGETKPDAAAAATEVTSDITAEKKSVKEEISMDQVMKSMTQAPLREGKKVKGKIIIVADNGLYVNIKMGKDALISADEVSEGGYKPEEFKVGDEVSAVVISGNSKDFINLSKKQYDKIREEEKETERILMGSEFTLACNEVVNKGLVGHMGSYTVFVPSSQLKIGYVTDLEQYKGKPLRLRAIPEKEKVEDDKKRRTNNKRIVASQRIILEEEKSAKEEHFWSQMIPGNIVEGKVKRYAPFGVFVEVMGFDCLVHISDVSWNKIDDASKVLKENETYEFEILKVDREKGRVSLSYKSLQKTPYEIAAAKYPVGSIVKGRVDRLATFGAFIQIEEGVDGLVHVSQISHEWIKDASQALKVGQEVEAKIIKFEDNKITLSIKELLPEPIQEAPAEEVDQPVKESKDTKKRGKKQRETEPKTNDEFREWVGAENSVTIGDLFADLKDMVADNGEKE